jgi:hypothetical protein
MHVKTHYKIDLSDLCLIHISYFLLRLGEGADVSISPLNPEIKENNLVIN